MRFRVPSDVRSLLFGSEIASDYLQPHIGGDIALLQGIAKHLLETNAHDMSFIERHTEGFAAFAAQVSQASWSELEQQSGVTQAEMVRVAEQYARAKNVVIGWCMGAGKHDSGNPHPRHRVTTRWLAWTQRNAVRWISHSAWAAIFMAAIRTRREQVEC